MNFKVDPGLGKVAEAYAADCVDLCASRFSVRLDYSAASVAVIEQQLELFHAQKADAPGEARIEQFAKIFGSYLGETYRRLHGGEWGVDENRQPALRSAGGLVCYPWTRAHKRIINGKEDNVAHWFQYLVENGGGSTQPLQAAPPPPSPTHSSRTAPAAIAHSRTAFTSSVKAEEHSGSRGPLGLFGKFYTLAITVIIDGSHPLDKEMRIINEHYINWLNRHGKQCQNLVLGFTAPPNSDDAILSQCRRLLLQDVGHDKTLAAMNIDVVVVNGETEESREYQLKWAPNAQPSQVKPPTGAPTEPGILGISGPATGQETLIFPDGDPMPAAIEEARRRIPEFKALLDCPQAGITVRVPWVCGDIHEICEATLVGRHGEELEVEFTPDYAPGPVRKTCRIEDILDWTVYHHDGRATGGFTARVLAQHPASTC